VARAQHSGRAYRGFFRLLEAVGVKDARSRWESKSPLLQRALPPLVIGVVVILLALPFRTPDPAAMVFPSGDHAISPRASSPLDPAPQGMNR